MEIANGSLEIFAALVIIILLVSMYNEKNSDVFDRSLTIMVIFHLMVLILDALHWFFYQQINYPILMILLSVLPTVLSLVVNSIFVFFVIKFLSQRGPISEKIAIPSILLFAFSILIWTIFIMLNGVSSVVNVQTQFDVMNYGWGYWFGHFAWASVCVIGIWMILQCHQNLNKKERWALLSYCFLPLIAFGTRFFWNGPQIFLSISLSLIWIYAVMQRGQRQRLQDRENELIQGRMMILLSQLQPHFMYNTLTTICGLCDENPKEAKEVTANFADYIRHNLNSLTQKSPIPFVDELEYIKTYLSIEKKRFENKLNVEFDLEVIDFNIPALTIQVLVENAVKHGITKVKKGGTIKVKTVEELNYFEVIVSDDGIGFDISEIQHDNKEHIGINNVRTRLWMMCKGTLSIESKVGYGTVARLTIPKGDIKKCQ
ncbi:sensor histidine kinase [Anaerorhabdus furcosa]|uniref:Histidine kinase-, DNA gyrase B-, and HSP90-like ATPase n=1 Tax=Anaerorhabdus furcosa TaxID=118967 RepID=A0A1T4LPE2_9FIRM|nr:histidine kinase [Anaerorhabdus furcosa]SJZ56602.1 Histidine kinase-, DNA gyrase B-, and HSP90-like ATPase [Anaerorhabdus furcosa]